MKITNCCNQISQIHSHLQVPSRTVELIQNLKIYTHTNDRICWSSRWLPLVFENDLSVVRRPTTRQLINPLTSCISLSLLGISRSVGVSRRSSNIAGVRGRRLWTAKALSGADKQTFSDVWVYWFLAAKLCNLGRCISIPWTPSSDSARWSRRTE